MTLNGLKTSASLRLQVPYSCILYSKISSYTKNSHLLAKDVLKNLILITEDNRSKLPVTVLLGALRDAGEIAHRLTENPLSGPYVPTCCSWLLEGRTRLSFRQFKVDH